MIPCPIPVNRSNCLMEIPIPRKRLKALFRSCFFIAAISSPRIPTVCLTAFFLTSVLLQASSSELYPHRLRIWCNAQRPLPSRGACHMRIYSGLIEAILHQPLIGHDGVMPSSPSPDIPRCHWCSLRLWMLKGNVCKSGCRRRRRRSDCLC